jgi:hypothetical protein
MPDDERQSEREQETRREDYHEARKGEDPDKFDKK